MNSHPIPSSKPVFHLPRIMMMGMRGSGKTSIQRVLFNHMKPNETVFLESTTTISVTPVESVIKMFIADFPGQIEYNDPVTFDLERLYGVSGSTDSVDPCAKAISTLNCGAIIFVVDAKVDYVDALARLQRTVAAAATYNPNVLVEVFIHKMDMLGLNLPNKTELEIRRHVLDDMLDLEILDQVSLKFHQTSIYNNTIHMAFSSIVQRMLPKQYLLAGLLDTFCLKSGVEKAFLFDSQTKISLASDTRHTPTAIYELCSEAMDFTMDLEVVYDEIVPDHEWENRSVRESVQIYNRPRDRESVIKLGTGTVIMLRQIDCLTLVFLIKETNYNLSAGMIELNFYKIRDSISQFMKILSGNVKN